MVVKLSDVAPMKHCVMMNSQRFFNNLDWYRWKDHDQMLLFELQEFNHFMMSVRELSELLKDSLVNNE